MCSSPKASTLARTPSPRHPSTQAEHPRRGDDAALVAKGLPRHTGLRSQILVWRRLLHFLPLFYWPGVVAIPAKRPSDPAAY